MGHRITSEARIFSGTVLTATDIAVAAGRASIGDVSRVADLDQSIIDDAQKEIKSMLQNTLDAMKTSVADIPVYLVGGGSILAPDELVGVSRVHRFPYYDVANAVGAAIAQVKRCFGHPSEKRSSTGRYQVRSTRLKTFRLRPCPK